MLLVRFTSWQRHRLRQHGAEWPERLVYEGTAWPFKLLRWAMAEGCTSPLE
jgi:hypothetical protein